MEDVPTAIQKAVAAMTTTEGQAEALTAADLRAEAMAIQTTEVAMVILQRATAMAILKEGTAATPMATGHQEGATMQTTEEVTAILQKDIHITTAVLQRGEATETAKAEASDLQEEGRHTVLLKDRLKDLHQEDLHQEDLQEEDRSAAMKAEEAATSDALPREASADATTAQERASRAASRQEGTIPDRRQNRIHTDSMRLTRRT